MSTIVGYSILAMVTDLWCHLTKNSSGAWHTVYAICLAPIISEMLPEIHTLETFGFLNFIIQSQKN